MPGLIMKKSIMDIRPINAEGWEGTKVPVSLKRMELEGGTTSYLTSFRGALFTSTVNRYSYSISFYQFTLSEYVEYQISENGSHGLMIFVLEGSIELYCANTKRKIDSQQHLICGIDSGVGIVAMEKGKHLVCCVSLSREHLLAYPQNDVVEKLLCNFGKDKGNQTMLPVKPNSKFMSERLELLIRRASPSEFDRLIFERQDVDELFRRYVRAVAPPLSAKRTVTTTLKKINEVRYYLVDNASENISVSDIARSFNMPINELKSVFKAQYGTAVHDFHLRQRVELAKKLLSKGDRKVHDIAIECGFCDTSHLNRMFKTYTGENPKDYRRKMTIPEAVV